MSDPEPDAIFRQRLLRVVAEKDRRFALVAAGIYLDQLARKYGLFRTGVPLKGIETGRTQA
ncbi:hypothetical protein FV242_30590 [Methylobacterium sp. WL64]|uniref:hypothetical protein n=1 Tax=Methylobacterium sp. WL64 TaxID=2603894 RepID=UPI0011CBAA1A|nr:hypothetical protein [Methylobacterium sp. WL64]TXM97799.1 hypothetical protein FV242_30590 [Methylobacterium sp. WL64]